MVCDRIVRVAYWIQRRSVDYFPALQPAQNTMGPGAEYLLLALQLLAGGDRWANTVQLLALCAATASLPTLCRLCGVPRRLAPFAALFVAGLPLATLEATTTQNDLVAALTALAVVSAGLPFLHRRAPRPIDVALFAMCAACTYLVKPTASLAALPFSVVVTAFLIVSLMRHTPLRRVTAIVLAGTMPVLVVLGPDALRKLTTTGSMFGGRHEIYPMWGDWADRLFNSVRAYVQNALLPDRAIELVSAAQLKIFKVPVQLYGANVYRPNEDRAGNPLQAAVCLALIAWLAVTLPFMLAFARRRWRMFLVAATVPAAWIVVHAFLRDQEFLTRLQLPVFALSPLLWAPFASAWLRGARLRQALLGAATVVCLAAGTVTALTNEFRPLTMRLLRDLPSRDYLYYATRPEVRDAQNRALIAMKMSGCKRVALYIDSQSYDYPLTWRAMRAGIEVRPYAEPSSWPCRVFSDQGRPPSTDEVEWIDQGNGIWLPGRER